MTPERDDLVERLKYRVGNPSAWDYYDDGASEMMRESVTALAEQASRIAALDALCEERFHEIAASRAECEGLRAALVVVKETYAHSKGNRLPIIAQIDEIVSAALSQKETGDAA